MKDFDYENDQWVKLPPHLKHLPLFTRPFDIFSFFMRVLWALVLKGWFLNFYIYLRTHGSFAALYKTYPKLLIISNHTSHLDAVSIAGSIPFRYWKDLYIAAAQDYFFSNPLFTFFSQHCLGAIPIQRKKGSHETIRLIHLLLKKLDRIWLIIFPEGTRSKDGSIQEFKKSSPYFVFIHPRGLRSVAQRSLVCAARHARYLCGTYY
jgi:1-acyl-sn-glycerol-3-phosphate acyltransferase